MLLIIALAIIIILHLPHQIVHLLQIQIGKQQWQEHVILPQPFLVQPCMGSPGNRDKQGRWNYPAGLFLGSILEPNRSMLEQKGLHHIIGAGMVILLQVFLVQLLKLECMGQFYLVAVAAWRNSAATR